MTAVLLCSESALPKCRWYILPKFDIVDAARVHGGRRVELGILAIVMLDRSFGGSVSFVTLRGLC